MKKLLMIVSRSDQQRVSPKWWRPITGINQHDMRATEKDSMQNCVQCQISLHNDSAQKCAQCFKYKHVPQN